jgi:chloramphenicol 3-O-phosphotransferase
MALPTPGILLITGIMAAGKSTVAQAVAERLPLSVHLRGDVFRRMVVNGRVEMTPDTADAALAQLKLRYRLSVMTADLYCEAGFSVVYQDVILGEDLSEVVDLLQKWPLYVVVLCPSPEVVAQREATRDKTGYGEWTPEMLDEGLRKATPRLGLWLDTSALSVEETVDAIFAQIDQAAISR